MKDSETRPTVYSPNNIHEKDYSIPEADEQEHAAPVLNLCHGIFTD